MSLIIRLFSYKMNNKNVVKKQITRYFKQRKDEVRNLLEFYSKNNYHQEIYQILVYLVEYDVDILRKKDILKLITEDTDDLSLSLLTIIYLRKKWKIEDLLKIDNLFKTTNSFILTK